MTIHKVYFHNIVDGFQAGSLNSGFSTEGEQVSQEMGAVGGQVAPTQRMNYDEAVSILQEVETCKYHYHLNSEHLVINELLVNICTRIIQWSNTCVQDNMTKYTCSS